ncbi:unnamed protein product [Ilex paraguariensis]|uniref:Plastid movement impaired 2 n=1 Tax=Ilex paraguariensis TaxID=185542 RepID=A0ABC8TFG1_9AQUA
MPYDLLVGQRGGPKSTSTKRETDKVLLFIFIITGENPKRVKRTRMGNSLGGKKTAKVMKITGETIKLKTPVKAGEVVKDYPGHVLLDSEAVKHFGIRAKPLELHEELKKKRVYFLVELPKFPDEKVPRRVRSGIHMSAKDRLESLMLAKRSASDLSVMRPRNIMLEESKEGKENGHVRMKMRLPKAELARLMTQSKDKAEAAQKIVDLYMDNNSNGGGGGGSGSGGEADKVHDGALLHQQLHWNGGSQGRAKKRVGFLLVDEQEIQLAVAS